MVPCSDHVQRIFVNYDASQTNARVEFTVKITSQYQWCEYTGIFISVFVWICIFLTYIHFQPHIAQRDLIFTVEFLK